MDVINKLYSSVSSTVSQLSGVLPGNPVTREFEVVQHIGSAGPGLLWKIYRGYKKSTRQEASIFVLEKRILERWNKGDRDMMLDTLKRGVTQLTKLRHPQILIVQHPLEESRESLVFATEPVFGSLANVLGNVENLPQPIPSYLKDYKLFEVEIKYGLLQICEGLAFLHGDVKLLHHNICPESIIINQQGAWKIFGFDFCIHSQSTQDKEPYWPFADYCPAIHHLTQPNLDFLAPEYCLSASHSSASDIYSLGMLIYCLHGAAGQPIGILQGDYGRFKKFVQDLKHLPASKLHCIPEELRDYVKLMLNVTPELRPDAHQFIKIPFFEDVGVKTLNYLDSSFQWDNLQKSQVFKGLPQIIQKLPHRVSIYRVLPCLVKEFVNPPMVPFVLPNVLLIAENSKKDDFIKYIFPHLRTVMAIQEPIQILLIFMQKMELLLRLTPAEEIKTDVLPLLYRALESDAQQIQELCLLVLPTFASLIDYPAMKNALLPRIKKLCISTNYISVRVNCLLCIGKLLEHLDKWLVLDEIIPFLPQIPSREPAVLMGILGIYRLTLTHKKLGITKEVMATKVLPFLMPLTIENGLTLNQFNALIALVKDMVSRVEVEHRVKLEQLNSIQSESRSFEANLAASSGALVAVPTPPQTDLDKMYSNLGLENFSSGKDSETKETNIPKLNGSSHSSLTLEDKQRIAKQQETTHKHNKQALMSPTTPQIMQQTFPTVSNPDFQHVKKYNFNQIKTTNPSLVPQNFNSIHSSILSQPHVSSHNMSSLSSQNVSNSSLHNFSNLSSQNMSNLNSQNMSNWVSKPAILPANQWDSNFSGNSSTSIPIKKQWPGVNTTQASLDLSAFDSLLPQSQAKVSMNQMTTHKMPLLNSAGDTTNNNKQLTNNDIMDLLG